MSKHALLGGTPMIAQETVLVQLIRLVEHIPAPPPPNACPDKWVVNGYPLGYETTYLRASFERRRARDLGGGIALAGCLHTLRRCQIFLLASDAGQNAYQQIARNLGCNPQTVRNAIHKEFNEEGLSETLRRGSNRPHTVHRAFEEKEAEALREMLHRSPREFGKQESSLWTLAMAAL